DVLASIRSAGWGAVEAKGAPGGGARSPKGAVLALLAIVGAALGLALWDERETRSDEAIFMEARFSSSSAGFLRYLEVGKRHEADVRQSWLPEAARMETHGSIVLLDRFIRNFFPSHDVDVAKTSLHSACGTYANNNVPSSWPTEFGEDGVVIPRTAVPCADCGTVWPPTPVVRAAPGDRGPQDICATELDRAQLDDVLKLQEPIKLWAYIHASSDPERIGEARAATNTALDALVAAVRANAADSETRGELVALLEVARAVERPAVVLVDDRTTLAPSHFNLSLRGALRFVFSTRAGEPAPDATWTFTKPGGLQVTVVMARGEKRIERKYTLEGKDDPVMRAFLEHVVGWPIETAVLRRHAY
ncbi:MAG TPA: hypothetical protein VF316_14015, partial [Polyangiaceae bacterium]